MYGAGQEKGLRPGTENVPYIVALGKACEIAKRDFDKNVKNMIITKKSLFNGLKNKIGDRMKANGDFSNTLPNTLSVAFEFGGELKHSKSFFPFVWSGMFAPEYTLPEVLKVAEGSSFSSSNMKYNVLSNSIYYEIRTYQIPVFFFIGTSPHELISAYYKLLKAPKRILFTLIILHISHFLNNQHNFVKR